jgi:putative transposase
MDETCIQLKGQWIHLQCVVDRDGQTVDFMMSERRNLAAARRFFHRAIATKGSLGLDRVVIDKCGTNLAGHAAMNVRAQAHRGGQDGKVLQVKYLNKITASSSGSPDRCWTSRPFIPLPLPSRGSRQIT